MTKAAIWSLLDQNPTFMGMFFHSWKFVHHFLRKISEPIFYARNYLVGPKNEPSCKKIWSHFCQKNVRSKSLIRFLTKIGPNFFATWFVFWSNQMISSMKNWVKIFVQKMEDKFSWVKKTYPWMSDFGLTKTKL